MKKLTLKVDRLAQLRTDELARIDGARQTPLCPVKDFIEDLLTGACITPPPSQPQLTCGCS